ncbi:TPR repeat:NB-ARC [Fusarium austroafricanum]|uniref:TPR repeat:NB-ARC n=1 Tax=Fusarium austroafricanum TaxID=2364996 RepID=A0A8H4NLQ7_9HYPO|nr:TPR repeat:NB-ARC [Fusarium austroafricanum]
MYGRPPRILLNLALILDMSCLCDKLHREDFAALTNTEVQSNFPSCYVTQANLAFFTRIASIPKETLRITQQRHTAQVVDGSRLETELQDPASQTDVYVRIFLAVEQSDQVIVLNQLIKRLYCFALALIHPKGSPIELIVERIQHSVRNVQNINQKVYNMLWVGRQWDKITKTLGAIATNDEVSNPVIGVLRLLGSGSTSAPVSSAWSLVTFSAADETRVYAADPIWTTSASSFDMDQYTEAKLLLILLSFLSDSHVSTDMFSQAAMPRRGWATDGRVETLSSEWVLGHILPTNATLQAAFDSLVDLSLVSSTADATYSVNTDTRTMILNTLPVELHSFWRQQALYVACAAIPWKYLHPPNLEIRETIKPHIIHTLDAVRDCDGYESVPVDYLTRLVSALIEASRFSGLKWKRTMITEARKILGHTSNGYLELLIAQREVLLDRLSKEPATRVTSNQDLHNDRRTHSVSGSAVIQETLNYFQNEKLSLALNTMNKWSPMQGQVSTLENIITFRINILRGKILRYQGNFEEAIQSLRLSQDLIEAQKDIYFDEDIGDLISELADTLQELGDFAQSEALLRTQLSQDNNTPATKIILQLSLAECLFGQQKFSGAEMYYSNLKNCDTMTKMARLRFCITAAKLCHVQSNLTDAFAWWTEALQAINKFPLTSGNATCIIYLSLCDVLKRQGQRDLEYSSQVELAKLQSLSSHAEAKYWIAGLRRWHEHISSPSS